MNEYDGVVPAKPNVRSAGERFIVQSIASQTMFPQRLSYENLRFCVLVADGGHIPRTLRVNITPHIPAAGLVPVGKLNILLCDPIPSCPAIDEKSD